MFDLSLQTPPQSQNQEEISDVPAEPVAEIVSDNRPLPRPAAMTCADREQRVRIISHVKTEINRR